MKGIYRIYTDTLEAISRSGQDDDDAFRTRPRMGPLTLQHTPTQVDRYLYENMETEYRREEQGPLSQLSLPLHESIGRIHRGREGSYK